MIESKTSLVFFDSLFFLIVRIKFVFAMIFNYLKYNKLNLNYLFLFIVSDFDFIQ